MLAEIAELQRLIEQAGMRAEARVLCEVEARGERYPVHAVALGNPDPAAPAVGYFGGVHGLERIGAEVVLGYLGNVVARLAWDTLLHRQLEAMRLVFMPLVNPAGLALGTRANAQGVDLMRNAPVEANESVPWLIGGQRVSAALPWYRGERGAPMQPEARALCELVQRELLPRPFAIAVDCHSGFGLHDRLWFPFAHTARPIEHLAELHALAELLDQAQAHHRYVFEPQSRQYLTHGDLWDHLYLASDPARVFLPLTLEMGSWLWVKKNPRQLFSRHGIFNPLIRHRQQRVLRRHVAWLDFIGRAACGHAGWTPRGDARIAHRERALDRWYRQRP
ncbi:MAG TPA: M14 family zinc carboxypeptidase [Methylibium sp.]|uniref:M14 family zinc carboxypeptidase n=1 Tax=Methylibium sp. TaxID=2067992 RepID=UPI002DBC5038|nr:M14 family zinc carboxypeptidase [Methylibium sp.]HEU4458692.1 M14 family zinc carboxypeptidase [Methylibium sp.]